MKWISQSEAPQANEEGKFVAVFSWEGDHDFHISNGEVRPKFTVSCSCTADPEFDFENKRVVVKGQVAPYMPLPGQPEMQILRKKVTILKPNEHGPGLLNHYELWMAIKQKAAGVRAPKNI